jgi:hypothetical protein
MRRLLETFVLVSSAIVGCGETVSSSVAPPATPRAATTATAHAAEEGCIPDPCDMCVMQPDDDANEPLDDGCPGFRMTEACALGSGEQARATRLAADVAGDPHITSVRIVSAKPECVGAVRDALVRAGMPAGRLETAVRGTSGASVFLEVGAWDGRRCGP